METQKRFYETPSTEVIVLQHQGVLCESSVDGDMNPQFTGFGNEVTW